MNDDNYRKIIARQWIEQAETALCTAEILFREQLRVGCLSRMYSAAFDAVAAALAGAGTSYGTHTAVRAALHRNFVRSVIVPPPHAEEHTTGSSTTGRKVTPHPAHPSAGMRRSSY